MLKITGKNILQASLRVRLAGVDYKNLVVNYINVMLFSSGSESSKSLPKSFVQLGDVPAD